MSEETKENIRKEIQHVAHVGDMMADSLEVEVDELDEESFGETIENSENVERYKELSDYQYEVLVKESSSMMIHEDGLELTLNGNRVQVTFRNAAGTSDEHLANLLMEFGRDVSLVE